MRPPLFSGGNPADAATRTTASTGFNEASALQRRKRSAFNSGRRSSDASMRPPLFSGGNILRRLPGAGELPLQ